MQTAQVQLQKSPGRPLRRLLSVLAATLALAGAAPVWAQAPKPALLIEGGTAVEMPGAPVEGTGVYRSRFVPAAPSRYAIFRNATNIFSVAVIERGKDVPPLSALGEADFIVTC